MAIYRVKTFADIYEAVREELKVQSADTVAVQRIKRDVNMIYEQEVVPYDHWQWLRGKIDLTHKTYYNTGTATVTQGSVTVTLSAAVTENKTGYYFSLQGQIEIYKIAKHTAGSATLTLESTYTQATASGASYRIWTDRIVLPSDCRETIAVTHDYSTTPMWSLGLQSFIEHKAAYPKGERRPEYYTTADYTDPAPYSVIGSLPALSTRASAGLIKTLVFAADVSSFLREGDFIEVSASTNYTYNGRFKVASVSTTTVTYTATVPLQESATADVALVTKIKNSENDAERYREMFVFPSMYSTDVMLHVDYMKEVKPLENDLDEPLMPIEDRTVLVYGALSRAWIRHGDSEEAARNLQLYERKIMKMLGKLNDSTDMPQLVVSKTYLRSKRTSPRLSSLYKWWKF
jgi:hypothetical protein